MGNSFFPISKNHKNVKKRKKFAFLPFLQMEQNQQKGGEARRE